MFTIGHFCWLGAVAVLAAGLIVWTGKMHVSLRKILLVFGICAIVSELIKLTSCMVMLERVNAVYTDGSVTYEGTGQYVPYVLHADLPLEVCSIQLFLAWAAYFMKDSEQRTTLLGFIYPTAILGGIVAVALPGPLSTYDTYGVECFLSPRMIQFFLYHTMLIVLGVAIGRSREIRLTKRNCFAAIIILLLYAFASLYLNSLLSVAVYEDQTAVGIVYLTNILSTYLNPVGVNITTKLGWLIYFCIDLVLGPTGIILVYIPVLRRAKRELIKEKNI